MNFGSVFSGFGGMDLGLEQSGMTCAWQVENNEYAIRVLEKHWPRVRRHADAKTFPPAGEWSVDLIAAGDPCQGNSNAGSVHKRQHADLGTELLRIVAELRPRFVLRENPSRVRPDALWPWQRMRSGLESLGYSVLPFRLRSCCIGADHKRERLFLLAELPDASSKRLAGIDWQGFEARYVRRAVSDCSGWTGDSVSLGRVHRSRDGLPGYVERVTGLGNAVPPPVARWIGRRIIEATQVQSLRREEGR